MGHAMSAPIHFDRQTNFSGTSEADIAAAGCAVVEDLDRALEAADAGFKVWKKVSAFERCKIMRKAADIFRSRADRVAELMTLEQGKPVPDARKEIEFGIEVIRYYAEEGRRGGPVDRGPLVEPAADQKADPAPDLARQETEQQQCEIGLHRHDAALRMRCTRCAP